VYRHILSEFLFCHERIEEKKRKKEETIFF